MPSPLVAERMHAEPQVVSVDTPLADAGSQMVQERIRHLPVVDAHGVLQGVLTDHAVFSRGAFLDGDQGWMAHDPAHDTLTAGDEAVPVDVSAPSDATLRSVLERMAATHQDMAVVVDASKHPVGILTEHDVVHHALDHVDGSVDALAWASAPVRTVERADAASATLQAMRSEGGRHRVVTDPDGALFGVVSMRDLLADEATRRGDLATEAVVRGDRTHTLGVDATLEQAVALMNGQRIGCVPLVDERGRPVAVVTRRDVMRAVAEAL